MDCVDVSFQKDIIIKESYLIGEIIMWPKTTNPPNGFISCDGSSYSTIGPYNKLYGIISYKFGGSGSNFNVPNLNVSDRDTPVLIKGDANMNNSGNKQLDTTSSDVSGGVNTITNAILPSHNHDLKMGVSASMSLNTLNIRQGNNHVYRANTTQENQTDNIEDGSKQNRQGLASHIHNIDYQGTITTGMGNYNITMTINEINTNNSDESNITPEISKIHYIIFTGVYQ